MNQRCDIQIGLKQNEDIQWCAYQNQNDPIYEAIDLFLTL